MIKLECCSMDEVGNHEDAVFLEHCVSWSVSISSNGLYASFQSVASLKEMQSVLVLQFLMSHSQFFQFWEKLTEWCTKSCIKQDILSFGLEKETAHTRRDSLQKSQGIPQRIRNIGIERKWLHVSPRLVLNPSD